MYLKNRPCFADHPYAKQQPRCLSVCTINTYLRTLRIFFSWLTEEGIIEAHPFEKVKIPKPPKKIIETFSEDNVKALLKEINTETAAGFRDFTLILMLLDTGLRLAELTGLCVSYVTKYKDENLNTNKVGVAVGRVLDKMHTVFTERDKLLSAQSAVPVYFLLFREAMKNDKIKLITRNKYSEFVQAVADNRLTAEEDISRADFDLLEYDRMSQQGANYAPSIRERFKIIRQFFNI